MPPVSCWVCAGSVGGHRLLQSMQVLIVACSAGGAITRLRLGQRVRNT